MKSAKPSEAAFPMLGQGQICCLIFFVLIGDVVSVRADSPQELKKCTNIIYRRIKNEEVFLKFMKIAKNDLGLSTPCQLNIANQTAFDSNEKKIELKPKTIDSLKEVDAELTSGKKPEEMREKYMDNDAERVFVVSQGSQANLIQLLFSRRHYSIRNVSMVPIYAEFFSLLVETNEDILYRIRATWDLKEPPIKCHRWDFDVQDNSQDMLISPSKPISTPFDIGCLSADEFLDNDGMISVSAESWWSLERHRLRWTDTTHRITVGTSWRNDYRWAFLPVIAGTALTAVSGWTLSLHGQKIEETGYVQAGIYNTQVPSSVLLSVGLSLQLGGALMLAIKPAAFSRHCPPDNKVCRKSAPKANGGQ